MIAAQNALAGGWHRGTSVQHDESNLGPKPWGPATEVRIALVDPERGIVIGYSILQYGDSGRAMQINEIFKVQDGRIRMIDSIGLMGEGIKTSGFTK